MNKAYNKNLKVLMVGPGRMVRGGVSAVVNSYYDLGLDQKNSLTYLSSMEDGSKIKKLLIAASSYIRFCLIVHRYDIVHIHMAAQASFTRKAAFVKKAYKAHKKIIIHQHAGNFDEFFLEQSDDVKREKIKQIFAMADKVIVLSDGWASFFGKHVCDKKKLVVLYNGVMIPDYEKTDYLDHSILFLGRITEPKGTYDLLKAMPEVLKQVPDAVLYFGGAGEVKQCQKITQEKKLEDHVKFLGWVRNRDKEQYLKSCSIFILPSYFEAMPMSVLEAMSYGLATVSTNVGGIPQIIRNHADGICIEAGDINAIAETLINLLKNPEEKKRLGQAGRARIEERFDVSKNIDTICKLYSEIV